MTLPRVLYGLVAIGVALLVFGWWGIYTPAGRRAYDEMAGMIPFFAGVAGGLLLVVALVIAVVRRR
jgi:hypothetical protein